MSKWKEIVFSDLFSEGTRNGVFKTNGKPVVDARLIGMGTLFHNDFIRRSPEETLGLTADEYARFSVRAGDLLFGRRSLVESGAGKVSLVVAVDSPTVFESSLIRVRLDSSKADPRFYAYYFKAGVGRGRIFALVNGAAVKGIRSSDLQKVVVHCPPLPTQKRIADILSAYDDLIENNRRRIALLEETARKVYRKRFGGEKADGTMMDIAEVCDTIGGGTPNTSISEYWEGGTIPWVVPTDVTRNTSLILLDTERKITQKGLESSSSRMLPAQSILMTSRASVGYFAIANFPVCTNQGFISIVPHGENMRYYLLHNLMERVEEIRSNAKGSTFPEISKTRFRSLKIKVPSQDALNDFQMIVEPIYEQVQTLAGAMRKLAEARDMLLPKLMSGEFGGEKNKVCL